MKIISNKPTITRKDLEVVLDCLINEELTTGNIIKSFENEISKQVGFKYSVATNSLTSAYHLIFKTLNIEDGDEIILSSYSEPAALSALSLTAGKAILVDCDQNSLFPSIESIQGAVSDRTKAVIICHTFGFLFPYEEMEKISVPIIEDISYAVGTSNDAGNIGTRGTFTVASFDPSMILTTGNGGIVMTNNSKHFSKMKEFRSNNKSGICYDYSMTDFQGAMGISQLVKLKNMLLRRRQIAKIYYDALKITSHKALYQFNEDYSYQTFPIMFDASIEKIEKYWKKNGIEVVNPIGHPLHTILGLDSGIFPNSTRLSRKLFSIPLYPTLTRQNIDKISTTLSRFI
jgi:perosamine synthetase